LYIFSENCKRSADVYFDELKRHFFFPRNIQTLPLLADTLLSKLWSMLDPYNFHRITLRTTD